MEQETLFTSSKWDILKLLENGSLSPIELASLSRTSVANISQQLRLLELAGLVVSKRVSNRDKGQPRILYSLSGNNSYLISTSNFFVNKKLHSMSTYNKIIMKIWFYPDSDLHYFIEKAFWSIDDYIPKIDALTIGFDPLTFYLVTEQKLPELNSITLTNHKGIMKKIIFRKISSSKLSSELPSNNYVLYDPKKIIGGKEK